jgi:hypothetical protein
MTTITRTIGASRKFTGGELLDYCLGHARASFSDVLRKAAGEDRERPMWRPGRNPVQIETEGFWQAKLDYLLANSCRKCLVRQPDYCRNSSAGY